MEHGNVRKDRFPIFRERLNILLGDMSTTDFADKVDVSRQTMGFYLNGERIPDSLTLARICKVCNVTSDWLLGLTNDPKPKPCAADELGLSNKAIDTVENYNTEQKDGLSSLLESAMFSLVCERLAQYNRIPTTEMLDINDDDEFISRYNKFEIKERELERQLASSNHELKGRVKVLTGYNYSAFLKKDIVDSFEVAITHLQFDRAEDDR